MSITKRKERFVESYVFAEYFRHSLPLLFFYLWQMQQKNYNIRLPICETCNVVLCDVDER